MNAEVRAMKTPAEQALAKTFASAREQLPGKGALAKLRERCVRALRRAGPAAPPRRGMEIHRFARAHARCLSAGRAARCGGESPRQERRQAAGRDRCAPAGVCRRRVRAGIVRSYARGGADHRLHGRCARQRRCAGCQCRQDGRDRRCRGRAQYRADGRRRGDSRSPPAPSSSARSIWCLRPAATSQARPSSARW